MSNKPATAAKAVLIGREHWDVPVRVGLLPYLAYARSMERQLHGLVVKWSHAAPPAARKCWDQPRGLGLVNRSPPGRRPP